jgi:hypothetical protein
VNSLSELTLGELAKLYDRLGPGSRKAKTLPIQQVVDWAVRRTDLFRVLENDSIAYIGENP